MKKRIIADLVILVLLILVCSCGFAEAASDCNVSIFKTRDTLEYLTFLKNLDETQYEILGITISVDIKAYSDTEFYMVTLKKLDEPRSAKSTGEFSLFKTKSEDEYCKFLANLDEDHYEIIGTSISMQVQKYSDQGFYFVTYKKLN